ncbi:MAG: hypothetical protein KGZ30_00825 [Anaplasmataceae bacterium]|nr:hypothetical protein [Anaplasmataceae bacterium]
MAKESYTQSRYEVDGGKVFQVVSTFVEEEDPGTQQPVARCIDERRIRVTDKAVLRQYGLS